jgi:polysaccharide export outer membrane protein
VDGIAKIGLLLLVVVLGLGACASPSNRSGESATGSEFPSATPAVVGTGTGTSPIYVPSTEDYRIGSQDLLELQVFGVADINRTVRVNSRGFISLPLIGMVQAAGLTSEQLEASLAEKLAKNYLQDPQVSVFVKEYTSQRVTVEGAVKKPGVYPIKGRTTLLQTLAIAEGLTSVADPNEIKVFRPDPQTGTRSTLTFDLEKIRIGELRDPDVRNDDIVQVAESPGKSVAKELIEFILPFRYLSPLYY